MILPAGRHCLFFRWLPAPEFQRKCAPDHAAGGACRCRVFLIGDEPDMLKFAAALGVSLACSLPAAAAEASLICFGNEPSWSLSFAPHGTARLEFADQGPIEYRGSETRPEIPTERAWRGRPTSGRTGELVAFLTGATCSDGMSEVQHPITGRVSLPNGRLLVGCCRVPAATGTPPPAMTIEGPTWRLSTIASREPGTAGQTGQPVTARF